MMRFALSVFLGLAAVLIFCPWPSQGLMCHHCRDNKVLDELVKANSHGRIIADNPSNQPFHNPPCPGESFTCGAADVVCSTGAFNRKIYTKSCLTEQKLKEFRESRAKEGQELDCQPYSLRNGGAGRVTFCMCTRDNCNAGSNISSTGDPLLNLNGGRSLMGADGTFFLSLSFAGFAGIFGQRV